MPEIAFTKNQLQDAIGQIQAAVQAELDLEQIQAYNPDTSQVPRPGFSLINHVLQEVRTRQYKGDYVIGHLDVAAHRRVMEQPGLRGILYASIMTDHGPQKIIGPAIVLPGKLGLAALVAERNESDRPRISDMQHGLLDVEYLKALTDPQREHTADDVKNPGDTAPGLVVASAHKGLMSGKILSAHDLLHDLAPVDGRDQRFGVELADRGLQDIAVGQATRAVRSRVLPLNMVTFLFSDNDQLPADKQLFDISASSGEIAVLMTLAAGESRGQTPDLRANLHSMVESRAA